MIVWKGEESAGFWRRVLTLTNTLLICLLIFLSFWIQALKDDISTNIDETRTNRVIGCQNQKASYAVVAKKQTLSPLCIQLLHEIHP